MLGLVVGASAQPLANVVRRILNAPANEYELSYSPDGRWLVMRHSNVIRVYDAQTRQIRSMYDIGVQSSWQIAPHSRTIWVSNQHPIPGVRELDIFTGQLVRSVSNEPVRHVAIAPNFNFYVTFANGIVRVHKIPTNQLLFEWRASISDGPTNGTHQAIAITRDGRHVLIRGAIYTYQGRRVTNVPPPSYQQVLSRDTQRLYSVRAEIPNYWLDTIVIETGVVESSRLISQPAGAAFATTYATLSPAGNHLLVPRPDQSIAVLDIDTATVVQEVPNETTVLAPLVSHPNRPIAVGTRVIDTYAVNAATGAFSDRQSLTDRERRTFDNMTSIGNPPELLSYMEPGIHRYNRNFERLGSIAMDSFSRMVGSPEGGKFAAVLSASAMIYDKGTMQEEARFEMPGNLHRSLQFVSDSRFFVPINGRLKVYDRSNAGTWSEVADVPAGTYVRFAPDHRRQRTFYTADNSIWLIDHQTLAARKLQNASGGTVRHFLGVSENGDLQAVFQDGFNWSVQTRRLVNGNLTFIGNLVEFTANSFPSWLSPVYAMDTGGTRMALFVNASANQPARLWVIRTSDGSTLLSDSFFGTTERLSELTFRSDGARLYALTGSGLHEIAIPEDPTSCAFDLDTVAGGNAASLRLTFGTEFGGPTRVRLTYSLPMPGAPTEVVLSEGASQRILIPTVPTTANCRVTVTATVSGRDYVNVLRIVPARLAAVAATPANFVTGGNPINLRVSLEGVVATGATPVVVQLRSNHPSLQVPTSVTFMPGEMTKTVACMTTAVASATPVTVTASQSSIVRTAMITVRP
ncbi:MAG: hypothetical protein SFX74_08260 [Fimbriimonadaceae bacterium]|nr:hypothetical protein [Fimbriimonadaceae bacterium]